MDVLIKIQGELKAPKNQTNTFGKYKYRSAEDILESVKPLCVENGALLTITDDVIDINGWMFVKATAMFMHGKFSHSVTAFAKHPENKKGMDDSQITGAASSYARKYALNGLFCIDDTKDADATNTHGKDDKSKEEPKPVVTDQMIKAVNNVETLDALKKLYNDNQPLHQVKLFNQIISQRKKIIEHATVSNQSVPAVTGN